VEGYTKFLQILVFKKLKSKRSNISQHNVRMYSPIHSSYVAMRSHAHTHTPLHAIKQPAWRRSCAPIQACNKIASTCLFYVEYIHETVALPVPWHFLAWQMMQCTSSYPLPSRIYNLWYSPHERTENKRNAYTKVMYVFFTCCLTSNHSPLIGANYEVMF